MPKFLRTFLKGQRKRVIGYSLVVLFVAGLVTYRSFVYASFFDTVIANLDSGDRVGFLQALWLVAGVEVALFGLRMWMVAVQTKFRGYMNIFVRIFGLDNIVEMNYGNLAKLGSGKLLQIVHSGMAAYSYLIYEGLFRGIHLIVSFLAILITLTWQSPWFLLFFAVSIGVVYVGQKYTFKRLTDSRIRDRDLNEEYTKQTTKILMNFVLLKIFGIKQKELDHLYRVGKNRVDNFVWIKIRFNAVASIANFLLIVLLLISVWYFGKQYMAGAISGETFFFVFLLIGFSRSQFYSFGVFVAELAEKMTYIHRYDEILEESQHHQKLNTGSSKDSLLADISYEDVKFQYEEADEPLFENLEITIPAQQKVAIVGRSGSGKSTFFKMLTKLVRPESGRVTIGETDLEDINYTSIYKHIGYFYQEPLVFDGTIRENLCLGTNMDEAKLLDALTKVGLEELHLETVIGERGLLLSGGEKQRLALARAFLFDYDVLLLDEPTSNLDLELEKQVLTELFAAYNEKTILVISHRPFVLDYVDRVIVMSKGIIKADGTFEEVRDAIDGLDNLE